MRLNEQHPLTDEICKGIQLHVSSQIFFHRDEDCLRAAADWQLEQVVGWLQNNLHSYQYLVPDGYDSRIDVDWVVDCLKEAMRPTNTQGEI